MVYCAIIGDIKQSKILNNRYEIQERLDEVLNDVNELFENDLAADFIITLGDEFQGLLYKTEHILEIIKYIQEEMYPVEIRIGVGIGKISTKINRDAAIGADGPAFYGARNAINALHDLERKDRKQAPDIRIEVFHKEGVADSVNCMLSMLKTIESRWSDEQRATIWDMLIHGGGQNACAKRMGTTQPSVARRLSNGYYKVYKEALRIINNSIGEIVYNEC